MNKKQILKYLPNLLILIGVGFWLKILCFSPITNHYEARLASYFQDDFERSSALIDSMNFDLQQNVRAVIKNIPSSEPVFHTGNKIGKLQQVAVEKLNKKLAQSDTSIYQIISDFDTNTSKLLWEISEKHSLISSEEITKLLHETGFSNAKPFNDVDCIIVFQKNQIIQNTNKYLHFLFRNVGYTCGLFEDFRSTVKFNETLKTGNTSNGKLFLMARYRTLDEIWRINGQMLPNSDGLATLTERFTNDSSKKLNIECEYYTQRLDKYEMITDTFIIQEQFIIHPIKRK